MGLPDEGEQKKHNGGNNMKLYVPTYENGKRAYAEIDSNKARRITRHSVLYMGTLYDADHCYNSPDGVWLYWDKNDHAAEAYRVEIS